MHLDRLTRSLIAPGLFLTVALGACSSSSKKESDAARTEGESKSPAMARQGGAQDGGADVAFQAKVLEEKLRQERNRFLVERHVENAKRLMAVGSFEDALVEVEAARDLAPANPEVLALRDQLGSLLGDRAGAIGLNAREMEQMEAVRSEKTRTEIEQSLMKARDGLAMKEFDAAAKEVDHALDILRWSPYAADWTSLAKDAKELRARIETEAKTERERLRRQQEAEATARMREEEKRLRERRNEVIAAKLALAQEAFAARDYRGAIGICESVLLEDPRNVLAQEIRDDSILADAEKRDEEFQRTRKQRFRDLEIENMEAKIPYTEIFTLPKAEYWQMISLLRDKNENSSVLEGDGPEDAAIRAQLQAKQLPPFKFEGETNIDAVTKYFSDASGIPVLVSTAARDKISSGGTAFTVEFPFSVKAEAALNTILLAVPDLKWIVRDGHVLITTAEAAFGAPTTKSHDVSDLLFGLSNFSGPKIQKIRVPGSKNRTGGPSDENPYGANLEAVQLIPPDEITNLIRDTIAPGTWDTPGVHIDQFQNQLIIAHSPEVQRQVAKFLADLRRYTSSMVTIEARFVTISENFLQSIGVDWRGLPNQFDDVTNGLIDQTSAGLDNFGLGLPANAGGTPSAGAFFDNGTDGSIMWRTENLFSNSLGKVLNENGGLTLELTILRGNQASMILRAVEKNLDVHEVNAQILSVANNQRSYITVVNQQSYIADYNVEVAQASFIAEPQIEILQSGVVLDVKPIINYNRKYITLELQPTVARVVSIQDFTTTLGGLAGAVTFQLPQLAVQSAFTTAVVPDGGAVLIGGLKTLREVEMRAQVPWLGDIPILGFFFKKEGYDSENENLMILIRARIADVREEIRNFEKKIVQSKN